MMSCEQIRELLPWYVNGSLPVHEARQVAGHVARCGSCRDELVQVMRLNVEIREAFGHVDGLPQEAKKAVMEKTAGRMIADFNVGSFLLGLSFGASYQRGRLPIHGDLKLLGKKIRLVSPAEEDTHERQGSG
jgi:predicted anti-sigma-YlaC factor YlaD